MIKIDVIGTFRETYAKPLTRPELGWREREHDARRRHEQCQS
jgi:hypothetical protein